MATKLKRPEEKPHLSIIGYHSEPSSVLWGVLIGRRWKQGLGLFPLCFAFKLRNWSQKGQIYTNQVVWVVIQSEAKVSVEYGGKPKCVGAT